jgi:hypothetical protein
LSGFWLGAKPLREAVTGASARGPLGLLFTQLFIFSVFI